MPCPSEEELADFVAGSLSESARAAIYAQLQEIMVDELPVMVVQSAPVAAIIAPGVSGYEINPLGNSLLSQIAVAK